MVKLLNLSAGFLLFSTAAFADGHLVEEGKELYLTHCANCHGTDGSGNGTAGQNLTPPPADLTEALKKKIISDEYLLWTIKEGGRNVHTQMPSFEESGEIDQNDAKAIINYLWSAFK
ncbi:cytochrome c [Terasakiella sp. A23]|uniref:c-type cytochrome n=1 Tax=Terasakiella sp. FCG-A23 TaxID=3080561 RepID=UPI002955D72D|nr:cytochrome c [Terasakiella sp. A23]MDV7341321.1 cytochrome c [Terasakiella sp. A23]